MTPRNDSCSARPLQRQLDALQVETGSTGSPTLPRATPSTAARCPTSRDTAKMRRSSGSSLPSTAARCPTSRDSYVGFLHGHVPVLQRQLDALQVETTTSAAAASRPCALQRQLDALQVETGAQRVRGKGAWSLQRQLDALQVETGESCFGRGPQNSRFNGSSMPCKSRHGAGVVLRNGHEGSTAARRLTSRDDSAWAKIESLNSWAVPRGVLFQRQLGGLLPETPVSPIVAHHPTRFQRQLGGLQPETTNSSSSGNGCAALFQRQLGGLQPETSRMRGAHCGASCVSTPARRRTSRDFPVGNADASLRRD
jgi:hypothetical protein